MLPDESPAMPPHVLVDLARAAEDLGYRSAWLPDHVLPPEDYGPVYGGVLEPLVTIAHLAAVTSTLRLGTSVLVPALRDPVVLAKQVATLHALSGGRVVLGVGVGWSEPEFRAVGADFAARGAVTDDALALLRHLFAGGTAPYAGPRTSYDQGVFAPVPKGHVPIMVGGNSDAALRRAARFADSWQGLPRDVDSFAERAQALAALSGGRVQPTLRIAWDGGAPVRQLADDVHAYRDAGAVAVAVHFGPHEGTAQRMRALAEELARR